MLDPDISTEDAKRLLSLDDQSPAALDRRRFLQMVGWGVGGGALLGGLGEAIVPSMLPDQLREAWAGTPVGPNEGILVLVGFDGGLDFMSTFVQYTNGTYYSQRGGLAIPANQVLAINGTLGFNNRLPYLKSLWDQNDMAIIQGVGYPRPDLSHFNSMAFWQNGYSTFGSSNGWIGRWLDGLGANGSFSAVTVGQYLPLHLIGNVNRGTAIPEWGPGFGTGTEPSDQLMYNAIREFSASSGGRGAYHDALASGMRNMVDVARDVGPVFAQPRPSGKFASRLTVAARLINANLGLRVLDVNVHGFDTHSAQNNDLPTLLSDLDAGIRAFFDTLDPAFLNRVTIMTYSEFGRAPFANDSSGVDHGTASAHMVIGKAVRGGLYGQMPTLNGLGRWDQMAHHVDFRSMYSTVLDGWMGGGSSSILGANYGNLGVFDFAPGQAPTPPVAPPSVLGDYVPLTPARMLDTRDGTGGRNVPLGVGQMTEVQITGRGGVPASDVTAVAVNVVSVRNSVNTWMTVWPTGAAKPFIANVTSPAGRTVPNLVIVKVGANGKINVSNSNGDTNCVMDVVGYFRQATADRLESMTPIRAFDSRIGLQRAGRLGENEAMNVVVAGAYGVPADASAVIVNITAVRPDANSWATVWPAGQPMPLAASLNYAAGRTISNLVVAKVGAGGQISVFNRWGSTDIVGDILGYMRAGSPGRYFPLNPAQIVDTRSNGGAFGGQTTRTFTVTGVGGVPTSGVSAVALNLSSIGATSFTYITAWPNGQPKPFTANLLANGGENSTNLAIVKVGTNGRIQLYNDAGTVHVKADIVGYFTA
jgi:uncharacterized protein (DUF1501 family)